MSSDSIICELCYREPKDALDFGDWMLVWQSYICPECAAQAKKDEFELPECIGGMYAPDEKNDPREHG